MAEVVHHEYAGEADAPGSGMGFFLGMALLIVLILFLLFWGLPVLRNQSGSGSSGSQINVPGKIDVNVQPGQGAGGGQPAAPTQP